MSSQSTINLKKPPIYEVVCGLHFQQIEALDSLNQGIYWSLIREEFPQKRIKPPFFSGTSNLERVGLHGPRVRSWFTSEQRDILLQVQDDRFYVNWRRSDSHYPRFGNIDSEDGIINHLIEQYERFSAFCENELGVAPEVEQVELAKVNIIRRDTDWKTSDELAAILPVLEGVIPYLSESEPQALVRLLTASEPPVEVEIQTVTVRESVSDGEEKQRELQTNGVQVEFRAKDSVGEAGFESALIEINKHLNDCFLSVFPTAKSSFN